MLGVEVAITADAARFECVYNPHGYGCDYDTNDWVSLLTRSKLLLTDLWHFGENLFSEIPKGQNKEGDTKKNIFRKKSVPEKLLGTYNIPSLFSLKYQKAKIKNVTQFCFE